MQRFGFIFIFFIGLCFNAIAHGDVHIRIDIVSEEIAENNDDPLLYVKRASLYLEDGDIKNASSDLKRSQKIAGKNYGPALFGYAELYRKLGTPDIALKYINSFLEASPGHVIGLKTRGNILESLHDLDGAAADYQSVIEKTTTPLPENYLRLVETLESIGRTGEAVFYCEEAARTLGNLLVFEQKIIQLHQETGNYNAALEQLDKIINRQERKEKWYYKKARIYTEIGKPEKADETLELAMASIEILPKRIRLTPAMRSLTKQIEDQRSIVKTLIDDTRLTGKVNLE